MTETTDTPSPDNPSPGTEALVDHYGAAARRAAAGRTVVEDCGEAATTGAGRYDPTELALLPAEAVAGSIGCANPVALAELHPGETVLDLGSGGGIDVLLSARRVGPTGFVYGLDMTPDMLELARANQARAGATNVEILEGRIEAVPLPDRSVDVVLSNCVVTLSADKPAVFAEAHRVLRPGGRLALADLVADDDHRVDAAADDPSWSACRAHAVTRATYRALLTAAGFVDVDIADSHQAADGYTSVLVRAARVWERAAGMEEPDDRPAHRHPDP
jgi:SAM-dependent methyltransferase